MDKDNIIKIYNTLLNHIINNDFLGYDPYDALNSKFFEFFPSKFFKLGVTQFFVYSPINFRPIFCVDKGMNPKGLGLLLQALSIAKIDGFLKRNDYNKITSNISKKLLEVSSRAYSGYCWGFNFPWQDLSRFSDRYLPTIVNTSFIGNGILDLYNITKEEKYLNIAKSSRDFILNDLNRFENENGICFSYTPIDKNIVHNASLLGTAFLSRLNSITGNKNDLELIENVLNFSLHYQNDKGYWPYNLNNATGKEKMQIDFHQGFILDSLMDISKYTDIDHKKLKFAIKKGIDFYYKYQFNGGKGKWRWPKKWPIDIHHQAQGIITFSKYYDFSNEEKYLKASEQILEYTIKNFKASNGPFYYQKWPILTNKIDYLRWSDAWMLKGLAEYLKVLNNY